MHSEENGSLRFAIMPSPGTPRLAPYLAFTRLWLHGGFSRVSLLAPAPLLDLLLRAYGFIGAFRA